MISQLGKYPRPLDYVLILREQPLGEVLVEPLEVVGNAAQPDTSTPVGLFDFDRLSPQAEQSQPDQHEQGA